MKLRFNKITLQNHRVQAQCAKTVMFSDVSFIFFIKISFTFNYLHMQVSVSTHGGQRCWIPPIAGVVGGRAL